MKGKRLKQSHSKSVIQMFLFVFTILVCIFCIALVPLTIYLKNTFSELQLEKMRQQLNSGAERMENLVTNVANVAQTIGADTRFVSFAYLKVGDYEAVNVDSLLQMKTSFNGLMMSLEPVSHYALQFDLEQNVVFTQSDMYWGNSISYYPNYFFAEGLSSVEWTQLLSKNRNEFLPLMHVKVVNKEYDALIYNKKIGVCSYLYVCIDIADIRKLFVAESSKEGYYITISKNDGEILYNDLPERMKNVETLTKYIPTGKLTVSVHVDSIFLKQKMQPLSYFLIIYIIIYIMLMIISVLWATRYTTKPVLGVIQLLEKCRNISFSNDKNVPLQQRNIPKRYSGFEFISESIRKADTSMEEYQSMISIQKKILQARFMEKALNGQLVSNEDIRHFYFYFPDFPESYCLLLLRIWTYEEDESVLYTEPLQLIASFLKNEIPDVYLQQFSDSELLLLISESDFQNYRQTLDFIVENINREEPCYFCSCVSSRICYHLENLPVAYRQLQDLCVCSFYEEQIRVCTVSDCQNTSVRPFNMTDLLSMYTAITYGNRKMAMSKLQALVEEQGSAQNSMLNRHAYEMIRTILTCIKQEHPLQLIEQHIPPYQADEQLYAQLEDVIGIFCDLLNDNSEAEEDTFAKEILQYIDDNYTDCELCMSVLEQHFKCAASTIRKVFKNATNTTVASYIEQKRMQHADELLSKKQKTVVQIALECGYANKNSFYKAYRRVYGHAPTMYEHD